MGKEKEETDNRHRSTGADTNSTVGEEKKEIRTGIDRRGWVEKDLLDPMEYTLDLKRGELTVNALYQITQIINTYGRVDIRNCCGVDILRLGLDLMAEFERSRARQEGK